MKVATHDCVRSRPLGRSAILLGLLLLFPCAGSQISAQGSSPLPRDLVTKAKSFKDASGVYRKAKCEGAGREELKAAQSLRDGLRDELNNLIATEVSRLPEIQGALDAATDAGEAAGKVAQDTTASEQDKAAAQAKFQIAKTYLDSVAKAARERLESRLKDDTGITLAAAADDCPTPRHQGAERKPPAHRQRASSERKGSPESAGSQTNAPLGPGVEVGVGFHGIGIGVGGGGGGVFLGR